MGFRFRKSISLGKGVRLNVSKRGVGVSGGVKGFRVSTGPSGTRRTISIPGTGISHTQKIGSNTRKTNTHHNSSSNTKKPINKTKIFINALFLFAVVSLLNSNFLGALILGGLGFFLLKKTQN